MHSTERREQKGAEEHQKIDLFDLLLQLWNGKKIILYTVVFALVIASAYLLFYKPKWVSTAVVSLPETGQVADYTATLLLLYPGAFSKGAASEGFLPSINGIRAGAFGRFTSLLSVRVSQDEYKESLKVGGVKLIQQLPNTLQLEYAADTPEQLDQQLRTFVEQINQEVQKQLAGDIKSSIAQRKQELTATLAIQEKLAKSQRAERLAALNEAQQNAAGSERNAASDGLSVVVKNDPAYRLDYADEFFRTQEQLLKLDSLEPEKMNIETFAWVAEPTAPQEDENNTRIMVVLFALIFGTILGAGIILTRNAIRNCRQR